MVRTKVLVRLDITCADCGWELVQTHMKTRHGIRHLNPETGRWNLFGGLKSDGRWCAHPKLPNGARHRYRKITTKVPHNGQRTYYGSHLHPQYIEMDYIMHHFWFEHKQPVLEDYTKG